MEYSRKHSDTEALYGRRERLLSTMYGAVMALFELEKNLANPIGATPSTKCELEESRVYFADQLDAAWSELEDLDKVNKE